MCGGAAVTWRSQKQTCVALSSAESEYMALASACQEAVWLQRVFQDLGMEIPIPYDLQVDNKASIAMAGGLHYHGRTKHISIKFNFVQDLGRDEIVSLNYCKSENNLGDLFTKPLYADRFITLRSKIGVDQI